MRYILFFISAFLGLCFSIQTFAQEYANEWIDYSKTYYRFKVTEDKLHRIPYSTLVAEGLPTTGVGAYKIYHKGAEIPLYTSALNNMQDGDYIEFYAQKNDGTYDSQLFINDDWQVTTLSSLFTDEAAYYLVFDDSSPSLRYGNVSNDIQNVPPKEQYFIHTEHLLTDEAFFDGEPDTRTLAGVNSYLSHFNNGEGFVSSLITPDEVKDFDVDTKGVYNDPNQVATVDMKLLGRSNNLYVASGDHHVKVYANGSEVLDRNYEGYETQVASFEVDLSLLSDETIISVESVGDVYHENQPNYEDKNSVGYISISYPHSYDMHEEKAFKIKIFNDETRYLELENFGGGLFPVLYDLTHQRRLIPIDEGGVYKVRIPPVNDGSFQSELYISNTSSPEAITTISDLTPRQFTDFSNPAFAADYIILTHPSLEVSFEGENQVQRYKNYRSSTEGGGYTPIIVDITEMYDQFSYGIEQHPQAFRNFSNFLVDLYSNGVWSIEPTYLFLLGKSIGYRYCTPSSTVFEKNLVPTYGMNGSDILLTSRSIYSYQNQMATGRVSAKNPEEIQEYLDKVQEYEAIINADQPCTLEDRLWLKDILQVAAGFNASEESEFRGYLENYEDIVQDVHFGANVVATVSSGSQQVQTAPVEEYINAGLSMITFVGHSNGTFWQYGLDEPQAYDNEGRYPFILSSSCFVGDIHKPFPASESDIIMAERFTLAPDRGGIGFLASVKFGFPAFLDQYTHKLCELFSEEYYGEPVSLAIQKTIEAIYTDEEIGTIITCQEFTLSADPAVTLYHFDKPEYHVENSSVSFDPPIISASLDSITINVNVMNLGKAVHDTMKITVKQYFPDGSEGNVTDHFVPSPAYEENYALRIPIKNIENIEPIGNNTFEVIIDENNEIEEDCNDNNGVIKDQLIVPTTAIPIEPCDFAIIDNEGIEGLVLRASTPVLISDSTTYKFEIDTTMNFDSPLMRSEEVISEGGVIEWQPPYSFYLNKVVYYWRVAIKSDTGDDTWQSSSFIFINGAEGGGWNQSHYFQFAQNNYQQGYLNDSTRQYEYDDIYSLLSCQNRYTGGDFSDGNFISFALNEVTLAANSCLNSNNSCSGGLCLAVFNPATLTPWESYQENDEVSDLCNKLGPYGNIHCSESTLPVFQFTTATEEDVNTLVEFMDIIPNGYYVLAYSVNDHLLKDGYIPEVLAPVHDFFNGMGLPEVANVDNGIPFIAFGKKGIPYYEDSEFEKAASQTTLISIELNVASKKDEGSYVTRKVGPAKEWNFMQWNYESIDDPSFDFDKMSVDVYKIDKNNNSSFAFNTANETQLNIDIDAEEYPYLVLEAVTKDSVNLTPPQLDFWRVYYERYPEASFNQNQFYSFESDTLIEGEFGNFTMAATNVSPVDMDSVLVHFITIDSDNTEDTVAVYYPPLPANSFQNISYDFPTTGLSGDCFFRVLLNPANDQPEKIDFNNQVVIPFYVLSDRINPFMDVTFDGEHIMDGDLVSAKPEITIRVKDESIYLPLDKNSAEVYLIYPDLTEEQIDLNADDVTYMVPTVEDAADGENIAEITFTPEFLQDGTHKLKVLSYDKTGNISGYNEYVVSFEVLQKAMISNVVNYPNPFTTSTRFIFTLTGSEVPENLKIQIMNVSGKVVKEITREELGDLRVGKNITEYAWDGFDTYGNELANGVYFYRVVANLNNESLDLFTNTEGKYNMSSTQKLDDTFSKKGIGKMYKLR